MVASYLKTAAELTPERSRTSSVPQTMGHVQHSNATMQGGIVHISATTHPKLLANVQAGPVFNLNIQETILTPTANL
jgi:hypothetical protein